jgi:hypothetical protein
MERSTVALAAAWLGLIALALPSPVVAAELGVRTHVAYPRLRPLYCGRCGCLGVTYVYHPVMESTYGLGFDPRNYDTTEPHFYWGRMRAWPRYFVEGEPGHGPCPG